MHRFVGFQVGRRGEFAWYTLKALKNKPLAFSQHSFDNVEERVDEKAL